MEAIDLFAGAGGFTAGARKAGCTVVWAANHSRLAVQLMGNAVPPEPVARLISAIKETA